MLKELQAPKKTRINIYLREETYNLLIDYMNAMGYDNISFTIDQELNNRFNYLIEAKKKAQKLINKNQDVNEWYKDFWNKALKEGENNNEN